MPEQQPEQQSLNSPEDFELTGQSYVDSPLEEEVKQTGDLPAEAQQLPEHAQQMFLAAFKAALDDGMDEEAATQVGWNSIENQYVKGSDGSWQLKSQDRGQAGKAVQSGNN